MKATVTRDNPGTRLNPLNVVVFACIFQDEKKAGPAMLEFLNAVLQHVGEERISRILSMRSEYAVFGESANQKYGRLDVRVKAESGRLFDLEVQVEKDFMNERGLFYGGRMGEDEFPPGTPYDKMPEVRIINLVDFYVRDDRRYLVEPVALSYTNNPGEIAAGKFKMYHIQLPAFRRAYKTLDSVKGDLFLIWLYVFDQGWRSPEEMEVLSGMTEGLKNFAKRYNYAIDDPELIRRYRMIEDGKRDIATRIGVAVRKAEQKTARRVERETALRVEQETHCEDARRMKADGISAAMISKYTGLSIEQIEEL